MQSGDVLDRNLARLLRQAYVPALPAPEFRDALLRTFLSELRRRSEGTPRATTASRPRRSPVQRWAGWAAAAALLGFLGVSAWRMTGGVRTVDELLADGEVALRDETDAWRAANRVERMHGMPVALSGLEVATPSGEAFALRLPEGSLSIEPGSQVDIAERPNATEELGLQLQRGGIQLERSNAEGPSWCIRLGVGESVRLDRGQLDARREDIGMTLLLASGEAFHDSGSQRQALPLGEPLRLVGGHLTLVTTGEAVAAAPTRDPSASSDGRRVFTNDGVEGNESESSSNNETEVAAGAVDLSARILDPDGEPVARFSIALLREREGNEYTRPIVRDFEDPAGRFLWEDAPAGKYDIFVHAQGFALASLEQRTLEATEDSNEVALGDVALELGGRIRGRVLDASGTPLADVLVVSETDSPQHALVFEQAAEQWLPTTARSLADGSFTLSHVSSGQHRLRLDRPGFAYTWTASIEVENESEVVLDPQRLEPGGTLEGRVERRDGRPWPDALIVVVLGDSSPHAVPSMGVLRTDSEGRYRIEDLAPLLHMVILVDVSETPPRPVVRPVHVTAGSTVEVDFLVDEAATSFVGQLLRPDGTPNANRNLALFEKEVALEHETWTWEATATDGEGRFTFENVHPGDYFLFVVDDMGSSVRWASEVRVTADSTDHAPIKMQNERIPVRVVDARTAQPLAGVPLILHGLDLESGRSFFAGNTVSDSDGMAAFARMPAGRFIVSAFPEDGQLGFAHSLELVVGDGRTVPETLLRLDEGASVTIVAVDQDGHPVGGADLILQDQSELELNSASPSTDATGRHVFTGLQPGRYEITLYRAGYTEQTLVVEARVGSPVERTVELARETEAQRENE